MFFIEKFPKPVILRVGPQTNYINISWQPVRKLWDKNTLKQVLPVQHGLSSPVNCCLQSWLRQNHPPVWTLPLWLIPSVGPAQPQPQHAELWGLLESLLPLSAAPSPEMCFFHAPQCLVAYRAHGKDSTTVRWMGVRSTLTGSLSKSLSTPEEY